jgi:hypothetical protein
MKLYLDFNLHPLENSPHYFRVRIFNSKRDMLKASKMDKSVMTDFQAAFCGYTRKDCRDEGPHFIGNMYLNKTSHLFSDGIHEITHAAVHYVREVLKKDLGKPNKGEYASRDEELLCESMEWMAEQLLKIVR